MHAYPKFFTGGCIAAAALAVSSCSTTQTVALRAGIAGETMYTAASKAGGDLVKTGQLDADQYHKLDQAAYDALVKTRSIPQ